MKKIKVSHPYPNWPLIRQTPGGSGIWGDYQFFINQEMDQCDYWVVFGDLQKSEKIMCPPENTIFLTLEPESISRYAPLFVDQFAHVITCQKRIKHRDVTYRHQGHPWFVGKNYDELLSTSNVPKSKKISIITSNKSMNAGHKKRLEFCLKLKEHFGEAIDLFGRGINDFNDKWDVLAPYEYSIAIENDVVPHWLTEKLYDCYLTHTFPLYYGCPNVSDYFDLKSLQIIDINDFEKSKQTIEHVLNDSGHYQKHLSYLKAAKQQYLQQYQFFPLVVQLIENKKLSSEASSIQITLQPQEQLLPLEMRLKNWLGKVKSTLTR